MPMDAPASPGLPLTGERTVPGIAEENYWFRRHEAAYVWAVACHGPDGRSRSGAARVTAPALLGQHARTMRRPRLRRADRRARRAHVPGRRLRPRQPRGAAGRDRPRSTWSSRCRSSSTCGTTRSSCASAVACSRPDGLLLVTTPNRLTFSPGLETPVNPFHTKEFTADELCALLAANGFAISAVLRPARRSAAARARRRARLVRRGAAGGPRRTAGASRYGATSRPSSRPTSPSCRRNSSTST